MARVNCRPHDRACIALHRPSTPAERARTRELNREALNAARPVAPAYAPAPRADAGYRESQRQYDRQMREYRQEQRRYELGMRRPRPQSRFYGERLDSAEQAECRALASAAPPRGPLVGTDEAWAEDHDPFAPTGGQVDPHITAPTPGLDGATTGLTQFNARATGATRYCGPPRRRR